MKRTLFCLLAISFICHCSVFSQVFSRFEAAITVKEKKPDGSYSLSKGKVYFNKAEKLLVYKIDFPNKELMVVADTTIFSIKEGVVVRVYTSRNVFDFSVFNLCLNGNLNNFGIENSPYKMISAVKDSGLVISTWELPASFKAVNNTLKIAKKGTQLVGFVNMDAKKKILSKQIFSNYSNIQGLSFPLKVINYTYETGEDLRITTFNNCALNNFNDETNYHFSPAAYTYNTTLTGTIKK